MNETFDYVEGRMDESDFFTTLIWNAFKALFAVALILIAGLGAYHILIPAATSGAAGMFVIAWFVTFIGFFYVFKPKAWMGWHGFIAFSIYSGLYSGIMYIGGETIAIAIVLLGAVVASVLLLGDIFFTGSFTYKDLQEWVKTDQENKERQRLKEEEEHKKKNDEFVDGIP